MTGTEDFRAQYVAALQTKYVQEKLSDPKDRIRFINAAADTVLDRRH